MTTILFSVIRKFTLGSVIHTSLFLFTCELVSADFSAFENYLCLQQHNLYRSRTKGHYDYNGEELKTPCNMQQMRWSRCLAELAQANVDECSTAHKQDAELLKKCAEEFQVDVGDFKPGQNIWTHGSKKPECNKRCGEAVDMWHDEFRFYDVDTGKMSNDVTSKIKAKETVSHFLQLMWADTLYVGCASNVQKGSGCSKCIVVCNYWEPGVYRNKMPYETSGRKCGCNSGFVHDEEANMCVPENTLVTETADDQLCKEPGWTYSHNARACFKPMVGNKIETEQTCNSAGGRLVCESDLHPSFNRSFIGEIVAKMSTDEYADINVQRAFLWMSNEFEKGSSFDSEPVTKCPGRDSFLHSSLVPDGVWIKDNTCLAVKLNRIFPSDQYLFRENCEKVIELNWKNQVVKYMFSICLKD